MNHATGIVEIGSWSVGMVAVDAATKSAEVRVLSAELNDVLGVCIRFAGEVASVQAALSAADLILQATGVAGTTHLIAHPAPGAAGADPRQPEFNALIEQDVIQFPKELAVADPDSYAIGFIETQGFTAVIEALDAACKAANVEVVGREKLGGGFVTVIVRGDVAAVRAAIDAAKPRIEGLGKLIAAHVIARPSAAVLALLPKV